MAGEKEIGLLQIRAGKQRNLPRALELGELALTTDEARMFVGIPSTVIPASLVAGRTKESVPGSGEENVELITEFTPIHVINRTIYKPIRADIPNATWYDLNMNPTTTYDPGVTVVNPGTFTLRVPSADRIFIDYVAFSMPATGTSRVLESGTMNAIIIDGNALVNQQNNTTDADGLVWLQMASRNSVTINGAMTNIVLQNLLNVPFRFEYIYRGWNEPM